MYGPSFEPLASKYVATLVYLALGLAAAATGGGLCRGYNSEEILNRDLAWA
jgi:hypothetical protein